MASPSNFSIYKGVVVLNKDYTESGRIMVEIPDISKDSISVIYTSPYFVANNGGMVAIPEVGCDILVAYCPDSNEYFYLSTILQLPEVLPINGIKDWSLIKDKYIYTERAKPQRITFTDAFGAGLTISNRTSPEYISAKVDLVSRAGKKISLSDSPESDEVLIRNEHGDGIVVTSDPTDVHSERSIEIKSKGAQRIVSLESDITIMIADGRDINIENYSTGKSAGTSGDKYGNVNIKSQNSDISLVTKSNESRVFIITPKARIQINADGTVIIDSNNGIQLTSAGDINLKSDNGIHIEANTIDIKATSRTNIESVGGTLDIKAGAKASINGATLHLNSGADSAQSFSEATIEKTDYKE